MNYESSQQVTNAIDFVAYTLGRLKVNVKVIEIGKDDVSGNVQDYIQGKNALYLIGNSSLEIKEYSYTLNSLIVDVVFDGEDRGSVENSIGWNYKYKVKNNKLNANTEPKGSTASTGNYAAIALDKFRKSSKGEEGFYGSNLSPVQAIALTILHVMGHNAGISSDHNPTYHPVGIMNRGTELIHAAQIGKSFYDITSIKQRQNQIWLKFINSYFVNTDGNSTQVILDYAQGVGDGSILSDWLANKPFNYIRQFILFSFSYD